MADDNQVIDNFTSNEVIEAIQIDDNMVELTGYISTVNNKQKTPNGNFVQRIIVNNAKGKLVQVVAWGNLIDTKFGNIAQTDNIIQIEGALAKSVSPNSRYNDGNVNFQLLIQQHTVIDKIGVCVPPLPRNVIPEHVSFDQIGQTQGCIRVIGILKNTFRLLISKYQRIGIGSITDGKNKIEIHITSLLENDTKFSKGQTVEVIGEYMTRYQGTPYFNVNSIDSISLISEKKKSFAFVLNGCHSFK